MWSFSGSRKISHTLLRRHFTFTRTFINARNKWVRDHYLDGVVEREKNLLPCLSLKHLILSSPSLSLPISISTTPLNFFLRYPSLFHISNTHVKLTPKFWSLHKEEQEIHDSMPQKELAARRLVKLLMLTKACRFPISIIDDLKFDLGLPESFVFELVSYFPEYFRVCDLGYDGNGDDLGRGLELVSWRKELAVPGILEFGDDLGLSCTETGTGTQTGTENVNSQKFKGGFGCWGVSKYPNEYVLGTKNGNNSKLRCIIDLGCKKGRVVKFPMSFTPGFVLQKRVKDWVDEWQCLPYISPYEDAFHLMPRSDQAEKWTVAVLHEILSLLVSKKTEVKNLLRLGDYLGFGLRFKKALVHHPGIFYVSNKIRTQTVVLREAFRKDFLLEKHPLLGMRHRYIYLMNKSRKRRKLVKLSSRHNLQTVGTVKSKDGME